MPTREAPISEREAFQRLLWLPLVVPAVLSPLTVLAHGTILGGFAWLAIVGSVVGGIPYIPVVMRLREISEYADSRMLRRAGWYACLLMTLETGSLAALVSWDLEGAVLFGGFAAGYSLAYVLLARLLLALGQWTGRVERTPPARVSFRACESSSSE